MSDLTNVHASHSPLLRTTEAPVDSKMMRNQLSSIQMGVAALGLAGVAVLALVFKENMAVPDLQESAVCNWTAPETGSLPDAFFIRPFPELLPETLYSDPRFPLTLHKSFQTKATKPDDSFIRRLAADQSPVWMSAWMSASNKKMFQLSVIPTNKRCDFILPDASFWPTITMQKLEEIQLKTEEATADQIQVETSTLLQSPTHLADNATCPCENSTNEAQSTFAKNRELQQAAMEVDEIAKNQLKEIGHQNLSHAAETPLAGYHISSNVLSYAINTPQAVYELYTWMHGSTVKPFGEYVAYPIGNGINYALTVLRPITLPATALSMWDWQYNKGALTKPIAEALAITLKHVAVRAVENVMQKILNVVALP